MKLNFSPESITTSLSSKGDGIYLLVRYLVQRKISTILEEIIFYKNDQNIEWNKNIKITSTGLKAILAQYDLFRLKDKGPFSINYRDQGSHARCAHPT